MFPQNSEKNVLGVALSRLASLNFYVFESETPKQSRVIRAQLPSRQVSVAFRQKNRRKESEGGNHLIQ